MSVSDHSPAQEKEASTFDATVEKAKLAFHHGASILPSDTGAGNPLLLVIAAMCYLSTLTVGGVLSLNSAVSAWSSELENTITIQLESVTGENQNSELEQKILSHLEGYEGVEKATLLPRDETVRMLEPWLGAGNVSIDLPIPPLIEVTLIPEENPDLTKLSEELSDIDPSIKLDDHTKWNDEILVFANFMKGIAYTILILIGLTTAAIIVFATRAGLEARKDIVEVLHLIGAQDEFIAREFQTQFLRIGLRASFFGLIAALLTIAVMGLFASSWSGGAAGLLIPTLSLSTAQLLSLILVPLLVALVILITARSTVLISLKKTL